MAVHSKGASTVGVCWACHLKFYSNKQGVYQAGYLLLTCLYFVCTHYCPTPSFLHPPRPHSELLCSRNLAEEQPEPPPSPPPVCVCITVGTLFSLLRRFGAARCRDASESSSSNSGSLEAAPEAATEPRRQWTSDLSEH